MPFKAHELYREYEPDKYKTSTQKKVEGALKEAKEVGLGKKERTESLEFDEVRELLGDDLYGPEEIAKVWNMEVNASDLPPLPSREAVEKAKESGEMLVLRMDKDPRGKPLTMEQMGKIMEPLFKKEKKGRVLYNTDWYEKEAFYTKGTPRLEWKFVSKNVLPGSTSKNYIEQTRLLRDHLETQGALTDDERDECTDALLKELQGRVGNDWKSVAQALANLKINKHHRRAPVEALYDSLTTFQSRNQRPLENQYDWTNVQSSDGYLVNVGGFASVGLHVNCDHPDSALSALGVVPPR